MARGQLAKKRLQSDALLVRKVPYREADAIVHLFTEVAGSVSAIARGARRSSKRFAALEPMHTLRVAVDQSPGRELGTLVEASLLRPRVTLTARLAPMEAAGRALRWLRRAAPPHTPEPSLWVEINVLLDSLDQPNVPAQHLLAASGVRLLAAAGWALELTRCVRCDKACPQNARARVDVSAGGVVCRNCGGDGPSVSSAERRAMVGALQGAVFDAEPRLVVELVERALEVHGRGGGT